MREIGFTVKLPGLVSYINMGLSSAEINFENSWMSYWDKNWLNKMSFLKLSTIEFSQYKTYGIDGMNNKANNTDESLGGTNYPEMFQYYNIHHLDKLDSINWIFYTYIDNLSFLGGLLDIVMLLPSFVMLVYTFRINEINVFFY